MRNFLARLGNTFGRNESRPEPENSGMPNHVALFEAQLHGTFDMDAIWYYERLKWQRLD